MSFLNPVNEPVLRFSSTDAGAPQINYNARTAGDIKAVLKACLVTGYGAKASAGWTAVNETATVAEFVSPSVAMSDYRLGIDDTSAASTTWYHQYQDAVVTPRSNAVDKNIELIDSSNGANGWDLLVTERGMYFIEFVQSTVVNDITSRLTYWGAIKSGLIDDVGINIAFYNIGQSGAIRESFAFYTDLYGGDFRLSNYRNMFVVAATQFPLQVNGVSYGISNIDVISPLFLAASDKTAVIGQISGMLSMSVCAASDVFGKSAITVDGRQVLKIPIGRPTGNAIAAKAQSRVMLVYLDYWEY